MRIKSEFTKYDLYEILRTKDEIAFHLPPACLFDDFDDLLKFIEDYKKVILRPVDDSEGRGVCILEKQENNYKITDCRRKKQIILTLSGTDELRNYFKGTDNKLDKYIFQKLIKSLKLEQVIFDIRVVMCKSIKNEWICGELEYEAGESKILLTNANSDSYLESMSKIIQKAYPLKFDFIKTIRDVKRLCASTCEAISSAIECHENIEFQVAIDENNKPWFVEINLFQSMKKFKVADFETYILSKGRPLLYYTSLFGFGNM
jgi:hypothetical protein